LMQLTVNCEKHYLNVHARGGVLKTTICLAYNSTDL
jgi:hypothetical protein